MHLVALAFYLFLCIIFFWGNFFSFKHGNRSLLIIINEVIKSRITCDVLLFGISLRSSSITFVFYSIISFAALLFYRPSPYGGDHILSG